MARPRSVRLAAVLLALAPIVAGCAQNFEHHRSASRAQYIAKHPGLNENIAAGIRHGHPVVGMSIEELRAAIFLPVAMFTSDSEGREVFSHRGHYSETYYYFDGGRLEYWESVAMPYQSIVWTP